MATHESSGFGFQSPLGFYLSNQERGPNKPTKVRNGVKNPYKWPYESVTWGVTTSISGVILPLLITGYR